MNYNLTLSNIQEERRPYLYRDRDLKTLQFTTLPEENTPFHHSANFPKKNLDMGFWLVFSEPLPYDYIVYDEIKPVMGM